MLGHLFGKLCPNRARKFRAMADHPSWPLSCNKKMGAGLRHWHVSYPTHSGPRNFLRSKNYDLNHFLVKERVISDSYPKRHRSRNTMNICCEGEQIFATPKYVSLVWGLFWAKGNQKPTDSGKTIYLPLNCLNLHWKKACTRKRAIIRDTFLGKKLICITGNLCFPNISSATKGMAFLPVIFLDPYSLPLLRVLYKPQLPGCLLSLMSLGIP